ncbi:MAG: DUF1592 domain-containing protein [Proteobacteria bacterium]|nr:MAG: DUF1592 domain-containing protein [Pseudomonadota bacterium]
MRSISFLVLASVLAVGCSKPPSLSTTKKGGKNPVVKTEDSTVVTGEPEVWEDVEVLKPNSLALATAFPRLTQVQWENSVRDVLLLDKIPNLSSLFPGDPQNTFFANDGNSLVVSDGLWQSYIKAAEDMSDRVGTETALQNKLIPAEAAALTGDAKIKAILTPLLTRAYRRPPTTGEVDRFVSMYKKGPEMTGRTDPQKAGLQTVVYLILQSPSFLYRVEIGDKKTDLATLTAYEVATRLSYAAWNSIPDAELFKSAASGELLTDSGLKKQATRMMKDPKADYVLTQFYKKIFGTETYIDVIKKDPAIAPNWPSTMGQNLLTEADLFINEVVVKENGGMNQLLTAPYAFVNSETAPFYKVTAPSGKEFVKTPLNNSERIGILTQIGFLAGRALKKESNAIRRGVVVSDKLLCADITSDVPTILPELAAPSGTKTSRDIVNEVSGPGTCGAKCHGDYINPSGYAFENFDAAGNYRTTDNGQPVDAAANLRLRRGLVAYDGPQEFVKQISSSKDLHECLIRKAVGMLYAREVDKEDITLIEKIAKESSESVSTRDLFTEILSDSRIKLRGNGGK